MSFPPAFIGVNNDFYNNTLQRRNYKGQYQPFMSVFLTNKPKGEDSRTSFRLE